MAAPFPPAKREPAVSLILMRDSDRSVGRVKDRPLVGTPKASTWGRRNFSLQQVRHVRLRPTLDVEVDSRTAQGVRVAYHVTGPVDGLDEVLADLERQLPNFDPEELDEIEVDGADGECLLTVGRTGTKVASVECEDRDLKVGALTIRLSNVRRFHIGEAAYVEMAHHEKLAGPLVGLESLFREIESRLPEVDLKAVTGILVNPREASDPNTAGCTLVARRAGTIVARLDSEIYFQDSQEPSLETLSQDRFIRPHRSLTPVTSLRLHVPQGDRIGECQRKDLLNEFQRRLISNPSGAASGEKSFLFESGKFSINYGFTTEKDLFGPGSLVFGHEYSSWRMEFRLPADQHIESGEYVLVDDVQPHSWCGRTITASLSQNQLLRNIQPVNDGRAEYFGRIRVWELERRGREVDRLAIDFILRLKKHGDQPAAVAGPPLVGMLRVGSSFE